MDVTRNKQGKPRTRKQKVPRGGVSPFRGPASCEHLLYPKGKSSKGEKKEANDQILPVVSFSVDRQKKGDVSFEIPKGQPPDLPLKEVPKGEKQLTSEQNE